MASALPDLVDGLRQPAYTGDNRCLPCTVVNVLIAVAIAVTIAAVAATAASPVAGIGLGGTALCLFVAAIYLRGYLVPGTPRLTERYAPAWLLRAFDKEPDAVDVDVAAGPGEDALDVEAVLRSLDAVEECEDVDDVCLTPAFRAAWRERVVSLREDDVDRESRVLAAVLGLDPSEITFSEFGDALVAHYEHGRAGQWESRAAFLADMAAGEELRSRAGDWDALAPEAKDAVLGGLRAFLERCPACDGPVSMAEETVASCCRSGAVIAVTCEECGARLMETPA
jgi:hypothetical protein